MPPVMEPPDSYDGLAGFEARFPIGGFTHDALVRSAVQGGRREDSPPS
jgi:hypothetical protein